MGVVACCRNIKPCTSSSRRPSPLLCYVCCRRVVGCPLPSAAVMTEPTPPAESPLPSLPLPDPELYFEALPGRWVSRSCYRGGVVQPALQAQHASLVRAALFGVTWYGPSPNEPHQLVLHGFDDAGHCLLGCGSRCPALEQIDAVLRCCRVFSYLSTPVGRTCLREVFPWLPAEGDAEVDENPCDLLRAVEFMEIADQAAGLAVDGPAPSGAPAEVHYTPDYSASSAASASSASVPPSPVPSSPRSTRGVAVEPTPSGLPDPLSATVSAMQAQIQSLTTAFGAFLAAQAQVPATPAGSAPPTPSVAPATTASPAPPLAPAVAVVPAAAATPAASAPVTAVPAPTRESPAPVTAPAVAASEPPPAQSQPSRGFFGDTSGLPRLWEGGPPQRIPVPDWSLDGSQSYAGLPVPTGPIFNMWPEGAPATETGAPASVAGPSRPPLASGPARPSAVSVSPASVSAPAPASTPAPSASLSLAAVVRSTGQDPRATRASDSLRELSQGDRDRAPSVVHATPESRDTPVPGCGMSALACRQCDLPRASAELAISPMSYGFSQVCRAPRDRGLPIETDRPPFDMVILADPVFQGEILVRRVLYRWARRHNDLDTYGGFQWAYPPPLGIMASDALTVEFPAVPGVTYTTVLQPILEWDARRPAPLPGQGLDSRGHPPPRASDYLETFGSRQCARRWRSREIRHIRLWPSNVEPLVDLFFPTGMRPRIRYHRLLLRALCLIAVEPFLRLFACGFLDWARGQVVLTQHRYYWAFLGLFPDGVWADVFLTVDRHDNVEDVAHYQAYLDVLLASRGTYQTDGH
eukprot:jgi/Mesvir1/11188/Mv25487-RA.1